MERMGKKFCAWLLLLVLPLLMVAQENEQAAGESASEKNATQPPVPKNSLWKRFWRDEKEMWTAPFHLNARRAWAWGAVIAGTAILIAKDEEIYRGFKNFQERNQWASDLSPVFSAMCEGYPFGVAGLFLAHGLLFRNAQTRETGSLALQAMLHSFLLIQLIKHVSGRQRPSWDDGQDHWAGPAGFFKRYEPGQWARYDAFASGHTITIWSLATVIAERYRHTFPIPLLCYALATLGGLSTITEDLHWLSDVLLGAALGYAIGKMVVHNRGPRGLQLIPQISRTSYVLSLRYSF
jgi:hypothetical protein